MLYLISQGECKLENMRTLCVACHADVTAEQCKERRIARNKAKKQLKEALSKVLQVLLVPNQFLKSFFFFILRNVICIQVLILKLVHIVPSEMWFRGPKWQTGWWSTTRYSWECVFWSKHKHIQRPKSTARKYLQCRWSFKLRWGWEKVPRSGRTLCAYRHWCSSEEALQVIRSERGTQRLCITRDVAQKGRARAYFSIFCRGFVLQILYILADGIHFSAINRLLSLIQTLISSQMISIFL